MMRRFVLALALGLAACGVDYAWDMKGAPKPPPDEQYRTGTEVGTDVWVWHCLNGERIAITQFSSAMMGAKSPHLEKGACGAPLASEAPFAAQRHEPMPTGMRWPGSPPPPPEAADAGL